MLLKFPLWLKGGLRLPLESQPSVSTCRQRRPQGHCTSKRKVQHVAVRKKESEFTVPAMDAEPPFINPALPNVAPADGDQQNP